MKNDEMDSYIINRILSKRKMIKIGSQEKTMLEIHYSQLYCNYISAYLKEKNIFNIPQMINCYTLYKYPQISKSTSDRDFFLVDYGMYYFFYKLNNIVNNNLKYDCLLEYFVMLFAEQLCLLNKLDLCYNYILKNFIVGIPNGATNIYYQAEIVKKTEIQELFVVLHEAAHFYVDLIGGCDKHIKYNNLINIYQSNVYDISISKDEATEIICDYESISYILKKINPKIKIDEFAATIFQTITYVYVLRLFSEQCNPIINKSKTVLRDFSLRFHGIYFSFLEYIHEHSLIECKPLLEKTYDLNLEIFKSLTAYAKKFIDIANSTLDSDNIIKTSQTDKNNYIRSFFGLL